MILGHYLAIKLWSPQFDSSNGKIDNIATWLQLPRMPFHYYHKMILRMLGQVIGNMIKIVYKYCCRYQLEQTPYSSISSQWYNLKG